jgi:hypothetical protein
MKLVSLCIASFLAFGCATASTAPIITADQEATFHALVEKARRAGATGRYTPAGAKLADAESDFYYAQHLPREPERARRMAAQARAEAEAALLLAQRSAGPGSEATTPKPLVPAPLVSPTNQNEGTAQGTLTATAPVASAPLVSPATQNEGSAQGTLTATAP